jgi:chorismate mutase
MLRLFLTVWQSLIHGKTDEILDHVKVKGRTNFAKKIARARERHGKDFHAQSKIERVLPPSRNLLEIQAASKPVIALDANVYQVRKSK